MLIHPSEKILSQTGKSSGDTCNADFEEVNLVSWWVEPLQPSQLTTTLLNSWWRRACCSGTCSLVLQALTQLCTPGGHRTHLWGPKRVTKKSKSVVSSLKFAVLESALLRKKKWINRGEGLEVEIQVWERGHKLGTCSCCVLQKAKSSWNAKMFAGKSFHSHILWLSTSM